MAPGWPHIYEQVMMLGHPQPADASKTSMNYAGSVLRPIDVCSTSNAPGTLRCSRAPPTGVEYQRKSRPADGTDLRSNDRVVDASTRSHFLDDS